MDDLIYTLLVVAWIVFGVVKAISKNKKKNTSVKNPIKDFMQAGSNESHHTTSFDGLLGSFLSPENDEDDQMHHSYEEEIASPDTKPHKNQPEIELEEALDSYAGTDRLTSAFVKPAPPETDDFIIKESLDSQSTDKGENNQNIAFDLREAVIYQVILERPY